MSKAVLVLTGDGINCERETARAFESVGAKVKIVHVNALLNRPNQLENFQVFVVPGGFSFGDELKSGKILAEKMRESLLGRFMEFHNRGGLTLGVCNGFQVLIQLGLFGDTSTLSTNDHGQFLNRWVSCSVTDQAKTSPWFKGIDGMLMMPMRHKEGRIQVSGELEALIPLRYTEDVKGSHDRAAALLDPSGRIFGIMPHPEAGTRSFLNPLNVAPSLKNTNALTLTRLFENAVKYEN